MQNTTIRCAVCNAEFAPKQHNSKICSKECRIAENRLRQRERYRAHNCPERAGQEAEYRRYQPTKLPEACHDCTHADRFNTMCLIFRDPVLALERDGGCRVGRATMHRRGRRP